MRLHLRRLVQLSVMVAASLLVSGCSIHPLPDDVTGVPTDTIVRKTRCEARAAIKKSLVDWLVSYPDDSWQRRLGDAFRSGSRSLQSFDDNLFHGSEKAIVRIFENSAIAYDFTLDITESDNLDATVDLLKPFHKGSSSAALSLGVDRTRQSIRVFTVSDTFLGLLKNTREDYCSIFDSGENQVYPIVGRIGIDEEVHIFIELSLFNHLGGQAEKGPPTMADTLVFTTKLSGSATPKLVFSPVGSVAHVADASLIAAASRTDVHKVIIGLALPPPAGQKPVGKEKKGLFVTVEGTPAQQAAGDAIDQTYLRRGTEGRGATLVIPQD